MIEELIAKIFCTRNCAHITHWKTGSYAEHIALGEFYDSIIDKLDTFVEVYQGNFKQIQDVDYLDEYDEIKNHLEDDIKWIEKNYEKLSHNISPLENILDEILASYLQTLYKLRFLK